MPCSHRSPTCIEHQIKNHGFWGGTINDTEDYFKRGFWHWIFSATHSICLPFDFPGGSGGKVSAYNAGDPGLIPGSGRSPGEGNGNPLQYSCLENPMDGGAERATVHGVAKSRT